MLRSRRAVGRVGIRRELNLGTSSTRDVKWSQVSAQAEKLIEEAVANYDEAGTLHGEGWYSTPAPDLVGRPNFMIESGKPLTREQTGWAAGYALLWHRKAKSDMARDVSCRAGAPGRKSVKLNR